MSELCLRLHLEVTSESLTFLQVSLCPCGRLGLTLPARRNISHRAQVCFHPVLRYLIDTQAETTYTPGY
jgi:hypothetical protein